MTQSDQDQTAVSAQTLLNQLFDNGWRRANYLIHWSARFRYIFVETPKAACTPIKRALQLAELEGVKSKLPEDTHNRATSPLPQVSNDPTEFSRLIDDPSTLRFAFVRNPFTRALSCYLDKFVDNAWERNRLSPALGFDPDTPPPFSDFLKAVAAQDEAKRDIHRSTQTYLLRPKRFRYSFIGRFENFSRDFVKVSEELGIVVDDEVMKKAHPTSANTRLLEFYHPKEIRLVQEIYAADFSNFGYGWSPLLAAP